MIENISLNADFLSEKNVSKQNVEYHFYIIFLIIFIYNFEIFKWGNIGL